MVEFEAPMTRREAVARHLREEILSGALAPGAPIRDAEIAARLQVSITPVREAITELLGEGLVSGAANKRRHVAVLTQRQAIDLMDVLGIVTVAALERAVPHLDGGRLDELSAAITRFTQEAGRHRLDEARAGLIGSIRVLLEAAGNEELSTMTEQVMLRSLRRITLYPSAHLIPLWVAAWQDALRLLRAGEGDAAVVRLRTFFAELVARMHQDRPPEAVVAPKRPA
ncbi:GntR family transcriptional regulator [Kocuria dechangensis]|uniref:GntR family transcriptional regulator n=1 Tax=Kocuria dechangensis TaxID=1176249 RepID=A0A917LZE4_9MICC|nr:GntR family transcriptional regulator [Kocuria dechangensis]GGG66937.1 GntR family transcriptional regulator [Kocuria dechangensis]